MNALNSLWNLVAAGSLRAGVLIAVVLVLRWALRGRVPAQCFHWLWILVAFRLLLPIAPASATSVFNFLGIKKAVEEPMAPKWVVREEIGSVAPAVASHTSMPRTPGARQQAQDTIPAPSSTLPVLALVWFAGVFVSVLLLVRSALGMRRAIRHATPVINEGVLELARECAQQLGIRKSIALRETAAVGGPALAGLWRAHLLLPYGLTERLTTDEFRFVLLHEFAHLQRRDLLILWLLTIARAIHWFNPLTWLAVRTARIDMELACDETLLRHAGLEARVAYGETLLKLTQVIAWRQPAVPVVAVSEGKRAMRLRMKSIASFSGHTRRGIAAAVGIILGTGLIFAADEIPKPVEVAKDTATKPAEELPEWAKDWSIVHVMSPVGEKGWEIEIRSGASGTKTYRASKMSDSEPWLENVEPVVVDGRSRWKAIMRKGDERAELMALMQREQLEIRATFIETNETTIRRLRLKAPKGTGVGLEILDDAFRGRQTGNILTPAQAVEISRALSNVAGAEVLSTPHVTTTSTSRAVIEIIREFRYPVDWERDEKEKLWAPKAFETRNAGVTLEVEPMMTREGAIAMNLTPQVVEFLGWKDSETGKAIPSVARKEPTRMKDLLKPMGAMGNWRHPVWRRSPVFSSRKITISPTIQSGETVLCADLPETEEVVPFKSPAASKRLVVLVTARLISGAPDAKKAAAFPSEPSVDELILGGRGKKGDAATKAWRAELKTPGPKLFGVKRAGDAPGFVRNPYAPDAGVVDVRGLPSGTEVKCPHTGRVFMVP